MNFEHNHKSLRRVALCLHRARQAIRFAGDHPEAAEFERVDLRGAIRQVTDDTASIYVAGKVGKYRNFRYWTEDALAAIDRGESVTRAFTGEHAIEVTCSHGASSRWSGAGRSPPSKTRPRGSPPGSRSSR